MTRKLLAALALLLLPATASAQGNFKAIHGVSDKDYQSWVDALDKNKFHPVLVSAYGTGATPQFAGIALDGNVPWVAKHNLTAAAYQKEFNTWSGKGYRL